MAKELEEVEEEVTDVVVLVKVEVEVTDGSLEVNGETSPEAPCWAPVKLREPL